MSCPYHTGNSQQQTKSTNSTKGVESRTKAKDCKKKLRGKYRTSSQKPTENYQDIYDRVTSRVIEMMEQGIIPWRQPWVGGMQPTSLTTKVGKEYIRYRGFNNFLLNMVAQVKGYNSNYWVTFKEAQKLGGHIKKGEHGWPVVFWKWVRKKTDKVDEDGNPIYEEFPVGSCAIVFNVDQCEGVPYPEIKKPNVAEPVEEVERILSNMPNPPRYEEKGMKAYYSPSEDLVRLPPRENFKSTADYVWAKFHEYIHSTGAPSRLNRKGFMERGEEVYSKEELVAALGTAYMMNMLGLETPETMTNDASYIQGWLSVFKGDKRILVEAGREAQKAVDYLLGVKHDGASQDEE